MDIRAFGSVYGQTSELPYASGYLWTPAAGPQTFPTCRAVRATAADDTSNVYLELNDAQGQLIPFSGFSADALLPVGATAISGGNVTSVVVLF